VSSRREQKEARKRERLERERAAKEAERRKRMVGYGVAGALAAAAVVVVAVLLVAGGGDDGGEASANVFPDGGSVPKQKISDLGKAAAAAGCKLSSERATSRRHITNPNQKVKYRTNPPTDGAHYFQPAQDGAYTQAPPDTTLVHSLEHGRIDIWFKPSLPSNVRADLKALFDEEQGYQMLLVPRPNMPFQIAASAWGRDPTPNGTGYLLGCSRVEDATWDALRAFIDEHRGNGPEPVP
jgi:hypothetical protein